MGGAMGALWRSGLVALGVGAAATLLALPAGWVLRRRSRVGLALAVVPMLMPGYLAYAAYSTLRENDTWLGDWLGRMPTGFNAELGRWLAMAGVALWTWPIAALILATGFATVPGSVLDAIRLDGGGRARCTWEAGRLCAGWVLRAWLAVVVITLGSAVPLHLAQCPTYAIAIWKMLDLQSPARVAWLMALPLVGVALFAAEVAARGLSKPIDEGASDERPEPARSARGIGGAWLAAGCVWMVSAPLPVALYALSLKESHALVRFWREHGGVVGSSAVVALMTGVIGALLAVLTWRAAERGPLVPRWGLRVFLAGALVPGVLIGSAVGAAWGPASAWAREGRLEAGLWVLVLAHAARFGGLGVLGGWLLARSEARAQSDARHIDGGAGLRGWWLAAVQPRARVLVGIALATAALSFHEIEAAVILQPAGTDSLARVLLDNLHFLRDQKIAAAVINLMVVATGGAMLAGWLAAPGRGWGWGQGQGKS
jgi:ABC-type Fe3+ transport system permease subunit